MRIHWSYAIGLGFFLASSWAATHVLNWGGEKASLVFYWLGALGVTSSAIMYLLHDKWNNRKQAAASGGGGAAAASGGSDSGDTAEVDQLVRDAGAKLAAAKLGPGGGLGEMPVLFLTGDSGSTKTTILMHSGMEPELLSGHVYNQDNAIVPTRAANFWFARKAVFVESGGGLWADPAGWGKLLKKLAPGKLKSLFGGKAQAPRAAILCVDVERFMQGGASEAMTRAARAAQTRFQEISQQFGISFPVYVIFTRADRLPFFLDYFRNLSNEEATQVFGATLPMRNWSGGVYAEEETKRLGQAFEDLFYSLCDKRIEFLPRENDPEKLPPCYEFPREFRKLKGPLVQFLVDTGRPSQLNASPFLRGFYFAGVRPVVVSEMGPSALRPAPQPQTPAVGATRIFSMADVQQAGMVAPQASPVGRKVPQWVFLTRLFNEIILEDKAAMGASGASTKTSTMRRILLAAAACLALLFMIAATLSFFNNRSLENDVLDAATRIKSVRLQPAALPGIDDLKRLDGLRERLEQLTKWETGGAPWSYRWGLYTGSDLLPLVRKAYYQSFNQLLFRETQQDRMLAFLRSRPSQARPEDDYNYGYHNLRTYLLTTKEWKRTTDDRERDYLSARLRDYWTEKRDQQIDQERRTLAEKQFEFYAGDLRHGNPFSEREDGEAVNTARVWLGSFPLLDSQYNAMLDEADRKGKRLNYNRDFAGTAAVIINNKDIRGAFTRDGWAAMQALFKNPKLYAAEPWVLPESFRRSKDTPADMLVQIRERYVNDYIARWRAYFNQDTTVLGYAGLGDAANKLREHSGGRPATLYLIGMASQNTAPEPATDAAAQKVRNAFQWAHNVVPPGTAYLVPGKNDGYVNALTKLQVSVETVARNTNDAAGLSTADMVRQEAQMAAQILGRPSAPDSEANLDRSILAILVKPTQLNFPRPEPPENKAGAALCAQFNLIKRKFPFDPAAQPEVTLEELNTLLRPGTGLVWQFYESSLKQSVMRIGNQFQANPSANPPVNPDFVRFLNEVARLADAFYPGGQGPKLNYSIGLSEVELLLGPTKAKTGSITVDGRRAELARGPQAFTWTGTPAHSVLFEYNDTPSFNRTGVWAIFRFFVDATVSPAGGGYLVTWPIRGGQANQTIANARFNVNLGGAPAVFDRRFMAGMRCIAQVLK
ncbi:MAG: ImcF-related family protein [Bryobacteraceae bacterium]|nr:ImcF-related family protein [Bryobacteraceae bacterium]